jgi:hypothetical protein
MFGLLDLISSVMIAVAAVLRLRPVAPGEGVFAMTGDIHHVRAATFVGKNALKDLTAKGHSLLPPRVVPLHKFLRPAATFSRGFAGKSKLRAILRIVPLPRIRMSG